MKFYDREQEINAIHEWMRLSEKRLQVGAIYGRRRVGKTRLIIDDTFNYRSLQHVIVTYDFSEQRVYINGEQRARSEILKGDFSNWDPSCSLVIGNEVTGDRPWNGKIYYVAIFDRSLTEEEIRQNYLSGLPLKVNKESTKNTKFKTKSLVARYLFDEGKADVIHDGGPVLNPVSLFMPKYFKNKMKPFPGVSIDSLQSKSLFLDIIINTLIFIPLGIIIHGMLRTRFGLTLKISLAALLAGTLFTLGIESMQHFSMTRNSSLMDVLMNITGTALGIAIDRAYNLLLDYRADQLQMLLYDRGK